MEVKVQKLLTAIVALVLCIAFGAVLMMYARPMADVSLNLSLAPEGEAPSPEDFDDKGWTVYTCEGDTVTELEPDGIGGFLGIELGQTFYYSRVMEEELDSPTLQLGAVNRTFSVWLDDTLIYTDCPELDNRIGYLQLPMREWDRNDPILISLPMGYQGKTLTIAQSFPEYTEGRSVRAYPAEVMLYCGYAYESELIAESFATAILAAAAFALGVILLMAFVHNGDPGLMCLSLVAFLWMVSQLTDASFFYRYFGIFENSPMTVVPLISAGALLIFLATRAGKYRKLLWGVIAAYALSVIIFAVIMIVYPVFDASDWFTTLFQGRLPFWLAFAGLMTVLVLGTLFWRKENWFYRVFTPIALSGVTIYGAAIALFVEKGMVGVQLLLVLQSGSITYIYYRTLPAVMAAALFTAVVEAVKNELERRTEKRLLEERGEMALASNENLRRQHEEVMMLRHDMNRHFQTLREISDEEQVKSYLSDLIGKNDKIRPVAQSGNEMLDIILNSKLGAAMDAGIQVDIVKISAPEKLPLSDADLCSLVMNIMDNAVTAASGSSVAAPFIRLDIHVKSDYLVLVCENSADIGELEKERKKETVPKHGLGLKIIRGITERYGGLIDAEYTENYYRIRVAIPLN